MVHSDFCGIAHLRFLVDYLGIDTAKTLLTNAEIKHMQIRPQYRHRG